MYCNKQYIPISAESQYAESIFNKEAKKSTESDCFVFDRTEQIWYDVTK